MTTTMIIILRAIAFMGGGGVGDVNTPNCYFTTKISKSLLHLGVSLQIILQPVNNWLLYIEPTVHLDVKKNYFIEKIYSLSSFTLPLISHSLSLHLFFLLFYPDISTLSLPPFLSLSLLLFVSHPFLPPLRLESDLLVVVGLKISSCDGFSD